MKNSTIPRTATLIGFITLGFATLLAYDSPATGFELSVYAATPLVFWVGSCFALLVSILVVFSYTDRQTILAGGVLGGLAMTTILSLPIIRGYRFVGSEDPLSHLGTAADINAGQLAMTESRYPVVHTLGSILHDATALPLTDVMLLVVVLFIVAYFVFIPLAVRQLTGDTMTTYIAAFSGLLLLPLNHLSPSTILHPTSQALMFAPAVLFVFFMLYRHRSWPVSLLFLTIAPAYVLLHPQQAANLLLFFGVIALVQIGAHFLQHYRFSRYDEWVLPEVLVYGGVFWLWVRNLEAFWNSVEAVIAIPFTDTTVAGSTVSRNYSLTVVGGSLVEVFMKLFFVSLIFAVLTALLMIYELFGSRVGLRTLIADKAITPDGGRFNPEVRYVSYGLLAVGVVFVVYLVGGISDQYFRQLGMLMVLGTILGSITLGRTYRYLTERFSMGVDRATITTFVIICFVLTIPVVFASPYIYSSSGHVTEQQMAGYETSFDYQSEDIRFDDIRSTTSRYGHAILGKDVPADSYYARDEPGVPDHFDDQDLPGFYDEPTYLPVPESDRILDPVLWEGFRFSHADFAYLDTEPGINRVQTNGGYDLYVVSD